MTKRDHAASQLDVCRCSYCRSPLERERFTAGAESVVADGDSSPTSSPLDPHDPSDPDYDLLGSKAQKRTHLVSSGGGVHVENLRGKIVGLLFFQVDKQCPLLHLIVNFYNCVIHKQDACFDMVFVAVPPSFFTRGSNNGAGDDDDPHHRMLFTQFMSTLPFPSIPFQDHHWRSRLCQLYLRGGVGINLCSRDMRLPIMIIIDTCNKGQVLLQHNSQLFSNDALPLILHYGPDLYPFTDDKLKEATKQYHEYGKEDIFKSVQDLLGSDTRDFLLDCGSSQVSISKLEDYDFVGLFAYSTRSVGIDTFRKLLAEIYNKKNGGGKKSFEIVFIDLMKDSSYSDEDKKLPWLTLPPGDEKTWILANMFTRNPYLGCDYDNDWEYEPEHPLLFIKPKGEARLELYGYNVIKVFGEAAYPFTEQAVARMTINKLQQWTLDSFVEQACQVGYDFNCLVRHKNESEGEKEVVTLSSIKGRHKGIILMFAPLNSEGTKKALECLTDAYCNKPDDSLPFEVIFVRVSDDVSSIPWLTLEKKPEYEYWAVFMDAFTKKTGNLLSFCHSCFLTFAPDGTLLGAGHVNEFENHDFPFIREGELMKHVGYSLLMNHRWWRL